MASPNQQDIFYCEDYFDLNDILAQANRVEVSFNRNIPKLGFLDPSAEDDVIAKNTKLELPLWIVKELNADQVVKVTIPKGFNQQYRDILEADATCVNLNKLGPNFYRFGQHLSKMNLPESENIAQSMLDTFLQRFQKLVNFALSGSNAGGALESKNGLNVMPKVGNKSSQVSTSAGDDINTLPELLSYANSLDNWEKDLMAVGQQSARQMKRWQNRDMVKVTANEMVTNLNKRKRLIDQHMRYLQHNGNGTQTLNGFSGASSGRSSPAPSGFSASRP